MNGIRIIAPVWGPGHVQRFTRYALPCLLAENNLPTLVRYVAPVTLEIHTTLEDLAGIKNSESYKQVRELVAIKHMPHGENVAELYRRFATTHGGTIMKLCHNLGIEIAWYEGAGLCPIVADEFFCNTWGTTIIRCLEAGKRAVMSPGVHMSQSFLAVLDAHRHDGAISVTPAQASAHLCAEARPPEPSHDDTRWAMSWSAPCGRGFLMRPHHVPVNFIWPTKGPVFCNRSADNDLAHAALDSWDQVMLIQSTTEYFSSGIEGLGNSAPVKQQVWEDARAKCVNSELQAIWLKHGCNDWHRRWFQTNFWCEDGTVPEDEKRMVEVHATAEADKSLALYAELLQGRAAAHVLAAEQAIHTWW